MDDLRIKAMDYALQARTSADDDVVALAERIHAFLMGPKLMKMIFGDDVKDIAAELPPPIPHNCDLGKGDQTPLASIKPHGLPEITVTVNDLKAHCGCVFDDDAKTRLVRPGL